MSWFVHAVPLPDGDRPVDLWVDCGGFLVREPVAGAEQLPGHYVVPGLVDAHAHPAVAGTPSGPVAMDGRRQIRTSVVTTPCAERPCRAWFRWQVWRDG